MVTDRLRKTELNQKIQDLNITKEDALDIYYLVKEEFLKFEAKLQLGDYLGFKEEEYDDEEVNDEVLALYGYSFEDIISGKALEKTVEEYTKISDATEDDTWQVACDNVMFSLLKPEAMV